jgi:tRNA threonylcarbamoyladenosine biosynthesis protein TsaE
MQLKINSINHLAKAAAELLPAIAEKKIIAFYGEMGAGKTTFIKALCKQMGVTEVVSSPTFSIINEYKLAAEKKIYHFDFYRIKNISEAFDMGYEEYFFSNNYCFIEWPEKIEQLLPPQVFKIKIEQKGNERIISWQ